MSYQEEQLSRYFKEVHIYGDLDIVVARGCKHDSPNESGPDIPHHVAIGLCTQGYAEMRKEEKTFQLRPGDLLLFLPGPTTRLTGTSPDFDMDVIIYSIEYARNKFFRRTLPLSDLFRFLSQYSTISLPAGEEDFFTTTCHQVVHIIKSDNELFKEGILINLLTAMALWTNSHISRIVDATPVVEKRAEELVSQFLHLVNTNFRKHRCLEFYADKLCITTKYLSNITRMATHKSASKLISIAIIGEAKKLLVESRMTVSQIADELGFPNVSSFGKYFKKEVGITPTKFRHTL